MANWSLPTLASLYSDFLTQSKERDEDAIKMLDGTTSTNLPSGAKRWNATGNKFEKWNGTAWSVLATLYEIKVRDSDRLNGQTASYYATSGHSHTAATTSAAGFMSSTDKSKLDGIASNANNYSHPTGDGNLHVPANGTANSGKFLQATGVAGSYVWANAPTTSLSTLGITATAEELNYMDGVTSNVQTQLNAKVNSNSAQALHLTDALSISGTTISLNKADGTSETISIPAQTNPTTAQVGTATAGLAAGEVGTYAFLARKTANVAIINGSTYAGSDLRYTGVVQTGNGNYSYGGGYNTTVVSGTWSAVGFCSNISGNYSSTIFLRIA